MSVSQPFLTYRFLADGLGLRNHDIWPPRLDEAAPFGQAGAHRVDHEGSLIRECSEKCDWYLHFLRYNASWNGHSLRSTRICETPSTSTSNGDNHNGRPSCPKVWLPLHIHVHPPRYARRLREVFRKSRWERIVCQNALHRLKGTPRPHMTLTWR